MKHHRLPLSVLVCLVLLVTPALCRPQTKTALHPTAGAGAGDQESMRQIIDLERQSKDAAVHRDADFSQRTLADDYVAITPLGQVISKADTVAARKSGQLRYDSIEISDMV